MTAPQATVASLLAGGGGKSVSWKDRPLGTTVTGRVKRIHPPQQQTDPATKELKFKKNGEPVLQIRVDLETSERDPSDPEDDGSRGLYIGGWMFGAVGDACRKAGVTEPQVGGILSVTLTERTPNDNPALQAINKFAATYQPPSASAGLFNQGQQPPAQPPAQQYAPPQQPQYQQPVAQPPAQQYAPPAQPQYAPEQQAPPQYAPPQQFAPEQQAPQYQQPVAQPPAQQYAPPPAAPQQQYAPPAQQAPPAAPEPARPAAISEAAWLQMDPSTRSAVAATMGGGVADPNKPPF